MLFYKVINLYYTDCSLNFGLQIQECPGILAARCALFHIRYSPPPTKPPYTDIHAEKREYICVKL